MTATTSIAAVCTNQHDHTIGHCRAQRHTLYSQPEMQHAVAATALPLPSQSTGDEWNESQEELARWGIGTNTTTEQPAAKLASSNASSSSTLSSSAVRGGSALKFEDVTKFWQ
ncbi:hypothetical protein ACJQWK_02693 [Exserohilum turcicum]|uniref:Uncharacterized protein n=1 Tax=Exserohilum turcicum (strain 28A) TaxID=671987 RepID=R0KNX0_EXST2|nr:uncharacterized protein SETTUDRAFT_167439 [Exserohilum turcica Et28A]EOA89587.1 hypothetical protein SETTUDRAFT_167439 [Exserohilum turcica Et28A]